MKQISISKVIQDSSNAGYIKSLLINYLLNPLLAGLTGFFIFFIVLTFTKLFCSVLLANQEYSIEIYDFIISSLGFILKIYLHFFGEEKEISP